MMKLHNRRHRPHGPPAQAAVHLSSCWSHGGHRVQSHEASSLCLRTYAVQGGTQHLVHTIRRRKEEEQNAKRQQLVTLTAPQSVTIEESLHLNELWISISFLQGCVTEADVGTELRSLQASAPGTSTIPTQLPLRSARR
ncbi:hypothetical protein AOLI_G00079420 [Acnodon oligacanthus]